MDAEGEIDAEVEMSAEVEMGVEDKIDGNASTKSAVGGSIYPGDKEDQDVHLKVQVTRLEQDPEDLDIYANQEDVIEPKPASPAAALRDEKTVDFTLGLVKNKPEWEDLVNWFVENYRRLVSE